MTAEGCRERREALGAYLLGGLEDAERASVEAHLDACEACRAEMASLSAVARLLPLADPSRLEQAPAPPSGLGERVSARLASERRRQRGRRRAWGGFALGAAAAAAAALAIAVLPLGGDPEPYQRVDFRPLPAGVEISATLEPQAFGTEIRMAVSGIRPGTLCRVFLRRADGEAVPAGSFRYRYGGDSEATLSSALDLSRIQAIGVQAGRRTFLAPIEATT